MPVLAYTSASDFELVKEISSGRVFGKTSFVRSKSDHAEYVLKEVNFTKLRKVLMAANPKLADKLIELNRKELEKLVKCNHPNISRVFVTFLEKGEDDLHTLVMEHCDGGNLLEVISAAACPFPEGQVQLWFRQLSSAVKFLHDNNYVHRDIKPKNVLLLSNKQQTARLGVFGLARDVDGDTSVAQNLARLANGLGIDLYSSPESIEFKPYSKPCDIWSLGVTFYHIANLTLPFTSLYAIAKTPPQAFASNYYSREMANLVFAMLQKDESVRPEIGQLLEHAFLSRKVGSDDGDLRKRDSFANWKIDKFPALAGQLQLAAARGKVIAIKKLLSDPKNLPSPECKQIILDEKNKYGNDILNLAALNGHLSVVEYLVDKIGMNVESRGFCQRTPLMQACSNGCHLGVVKYLVETKGADLDAEESQLGMKAIHLAASLADTAIVGYLLEKRPDLLEAKSSKFGKTPLLHAAGSKNVATVQFLIETKEANIDAEDDELGSKAIHLASAFGDVDVVSYLLKRKPDFLETRSKRYGRTPLLHAAVKGNLPAIEYLLNEQNADLMATDESEHGDSAVHLAAFFGQAETVAYLLEWNPEFLEMKNKAGCTPMERAKQNNKSDIAKLLHDRGAKS